MSKKLVVPGRGVKVVVFGTDNSGKTTLATSLSQVFILNYQRSLGPATLEQQIDFMNSKLNNAENLVFDRFAIIEEHTCGKVIRNQDNFADYPLQQSFDNFYNLVDLFIYCNPGIKKITDWGEREQMQGVKENIHLLEAAYDKIYEQLWENSMPVIKYNWAKDDVEKVVFRRVTEIFYNSYNRRLKT